MSNLNSPQPLRSVVINGSPSTITAVPGTFHEIDAAGGAVTVILPTSTGGDQVLIKKIDTTGNVVTISGRIGGAQTLLPLRLQDQGVTFLSDQSGGWLITDTALSVAAFSSGLSQFNVKDYGAVGDGITDDLAAIQSAINAAQTAGGGTVVFPTGTYVVSGAPTITGSNIIAQGTGDGSKILLAPASMNAAGTTIGIWINGGANVLVENLCIDGNASNIAKSGSYHTASTLWSPVIAQYGASSLKVYQQGGGGVDSQTYLKQRMPIRITNASNVTVKGCLLTNSLSAGVLADSTSVNGCRDILVTGNRIYMTWDNGVYFHQGVQYGTAANNIISDTTYNGVSAVFCDHIEITGNNIRNAGPSDSDSGGIQINGSSNCNVANNLIAACQFYGVEVLATQETNITGGAGGNAVWGFNNTIASNTITGCHANDYPTHSAEGVNLFGADSTNITGNTINDCDFGISMGSQATNVVVTNNRVTGCSSLGLNVGNSADVVNVAIKSNFIAYNKSHGVYANAAARYEQNTIVGNVGMGINLSTPPAGVPSKVDWIVGNTIADNTDSGILTNIGAASVAVIERNTFTNSPGVLFGDASVTYNSTTITSASAAFTASDVGLPLVLINQGSGATMTATTIASVTNGTTVVLAAPAQATQTGVRFLVGRGPAYYSDGATTNVANSVLTSATAGFTSSDVGKLVTVLSNAVVPTVFEGTINSVTNATTAVLSGNAGALTGAGIIINRSAGQSTRAINNYNGYPVIARGNTVWGIPEILGSGGTTNYIAGG